ncbi:MAG: GNAT family N-acetyltransferase [Flavobacteriaceae bacterium]|uniref:GNAT family N-acetyltransferase n=1 Tax=Flavobacterium kayseriense TaxID=2764714 RepID=A0ABR7J943_9FLAO|nr:GNAT family N-acetyltransferase [Flavobacterium kayseriense]MBC5842058.1 GNAT family N-acetyltransferase [Flavobacterium kayseriense]MBC5848588.1 GNAT family N-acetyltransferase [Flavobacterium kayseriense]MBX9887898.1 GNAT family N-acetyltransferase [Flavobacteriaceae bacterium]
MITKATLQDIPALLSLINGAYRGESSKAGWTTEAELLGGQRTDGGELTQILLDPKNTLLKYTEADQILGCVLLTAEEKQLYLGMLSVAPQLQNSGIGAKLLAQADLHAKQLNLPKIVMTVISIRSELIAYYIRKGYVDTGLKAPFPKSHLHSVLGSETLDFVVLEKAIAL